MSWYSLTDIAREAGYCTLPKGGTWVCIMGNPMAFRGSRIIPAHREAGIQHMDIYWGSKEVFPYGPKVNRRGKRNLELNIAIAYDISQGATQEDALARAVGELQNFVAMAPFGNSPLQHTLITIAHPHPEEVRFYNGEIRVFDREMLHELLGTNCLEIIHFGKTQQVVLEDTIRELVDALQLDGLSWAEGYQEMLGIGVIEPEGFIPQWFYRPCGWFRRQFCEEEQ